MFIIILMLCLLILNIGVNGQVMMPKKPAVLPVPEDIPFIKCDVCKRATKSLFKEVKAMREKKNPVKLSEDEILGVVEKACDPDSDHGKWMRYLEILESKDSLKLQEHSKQGKCNEECKTIASSCEQTIGDIDTDIGELLWQNNLKLSPFINQICHTISNACTKPSQKFVKGKRKDFQFVEMTDKDIEAEKMLASMKGKPGMPGMEMYTPEELKQMQEQMGGGNPEMSAQQEKQQEQQSNPDQFKSKLGFFDTIKAMAHDFVSKAKQLFGFKEKSEL